MLVELLKGRSATILVHSCLVIITNGSFIKRVSFTYMSGACFLISKHHSDASFLHANVLIASISFKLLLPGDFRSSDLAGMRCINNCINIKVYSVLCHPKLLECCVRVVTLQHFVVQGHALKECTRHQI